MHCLHNDFSFFPTKFSPWFTVPLRLQPMLRITLHFTVVLLFICYVTIFMALLSTKFEYDLKRIIALVALSQLDITARILLYKI
jgi:hypothetical protein